MIELPEAVVLARQINETLSGKRIEQAVANSSPHGFAWYTGDPAEYNQRLAGKVIGPAAGSAGNIEIVAGDMQLSISAPIRYFAKGEKRPPKHQLNLEFDDGTGITSSAQMWGGFFCYPLGEKGGFADVDIAKNRPSPLTDAFDRAYFDGLFNADTPKLSAKAFLATEQRIPGLGNGVLQDILYHAALHPKSKMGRLSETDLDALYQAIKSTLTTMAAAGGRDTEKDLYGCSGDYKTVLSSKSKGTPCPICGTAIVQAAYLGGNIYTCPTCQVIKK